MFCKEIPTDSIKIRNASNAHIPCEFLKPLMRADASMNTHTYGNVSPIYKLRLGSITLYPISISREWRDDVVKLILLEI